MKEQLNEQIILDIFYKDYIKNSFQKYIIYSMIKNKIPSSTSSEGLTIKNIIAVDFNEWENIYELRIFWKEKVDTDRIYWNQDKKILSSINKSLKNFANVSFSESGMQGTDYSSFDIRINKKYSIEEDE